MKFVSHRRGSCIEKKTRKSGGGNRAGRLEVYDHRNLLLHFRLYLFYQHPTKRNTTHSGGASFWSIFDLRCKSPACGDFYRKAEGNPQRFPSQTPPSSRRTKDSAFVRRKELAADTHARSAFQSEVRQGLCVEPISSMPRAWI